ncbi:MAG: NosD domain-containing protein [Methanosarcinaceae archaeon]
MWKVKRISVIFFVLVLVVNLVIIGDVSATTIYVDDDGQAQFATIEAALNNSFPGDEIVVKSGIYTENIDVAKNVTIVSESGNPADTIIQAASSTDHIFNVTADGVKISGFNIKGASGIWCAGILLEGVEYCVIENNELSENEIGIRLDSSSSNTLENNIASNNTEDGVYISDSNSNTLKNNIGSNNFNGIYLSGSCSNNTLSNNTALNNFFGIFQVGSSDNNSLSNNTASNNTECGIYLGNSNNNMLSNNKALYNSMEGIVLFECNNNTLSRNKAGNNWRGIYLCYSSNNTLSNNKALYNSMEGISFKNSGNNILSSNIALNNAMDGIFLEGSSDNTLKNNTANLNDDRGIDLENSSDNILTDNTANLNDGCGIELEDSSNNTLSNNKANSNNWSGISLEGSSNNTLNNNTELNNWYGIDLWDSIENAFIKNIASNNTEFGIWLYNSSNNTLSSNTVKLNSEYGIYLINSENNTIFNNHFNNTNNTYFEGTNPGNVWNTTITLAPNIVGGPYLGGNFWANPDGTVYPEEGKDIDHNGIFDSQYNIEGSGFIDYLPLRKPGPMTITVNNSTGPAADFESIQDAVNAAYDGDTVLVYAGMYTENVDVDKANITIRSESGNPLDTVVQAVDSPQVFSVTSDRVIISGFSIKGADNSGSGIRLTGVEYCLIENNELSNNEEGIWLGFSSNNALSNNTAPNNKYGIYLLYSYNNTLENNTALNNNCGIYLLAFSDSNTLNNNTASNNDNGIFLDSSSSNTLSINTASNNQNGMYLRDSNNNTLNNNTASNNDNGIFLDSSSINTLSNNKVSSSEYGIFLEDSRNNALENNIASSTKYGIHLKDSRNNTLENNELSENYGGVLLFSSSSNTLENNMASNNKYGIDLENSSSNMLENNIVSNNNYSINLVYSMSNKLSNNTASNNDYGIYLWDSSNNNTLENNIASNNQCGIYLWDSSDNNTFENNIASNNQYGIYLRDSSNNTLENNIASNNQYGIYLWDSSDNFVYNNYFNNTNNAYFEGTNPDNIWNTTKTSGSNIVSGPYLGGNLWATPTENGFSQTNDDTEGDGICDMAYDLGEGNIDYLPLLIPSPAEHPKNEGDDGVPVITCNPRGEYSDETPEKIVLTETSQQCVREGVSVNYVFQNPENCIVAVSFVPEKTVGFVISKVEILNGFSSEVLAPPKCIIYKIMNIQVGNPEFSSFEGNFKNPTIKFRVEKNWIKENNIDVSTITLNRYSEGKWNPLPTSKISEDSEFIYFVAETPAFSLFAITGRTIDIPDPGPVKKRYSKEPITEKSNSVSGFKLWNGVLGLLISIMVKRNLRK